MAVVPGRLDEQPSGVAVAGFRDVAAVVLVPGGVLARGQAEVAHQLARVAEAAEVTDLGEQAQRGAGGDAAEGAKPGDRIGPRLALAICSSCAIERGELASRPSRWVQHLLERELGERVVQALAASQRRC